MAEKTKVTRITAKDDAGKKAPAAKKATTTPAKATSKKAVKATSVKAVKQPRVKKGSSKKNIFTRMGEYFAGAWYELKQVRWPDRKATWGLTVAVLLFSLLFVGIIVLLDLAFKSLFEFIII